MSATIGPRTPESGRVFYEVSGKVNSEKLPVVAEIFNRILTPLYGSQEKALRQIGESLDRRCYLLYEGETASGVLVFKTVLSNEFAEFGIKDSIEIKSLFVDNSNENSGKGLGSDLVKKITEEAEKLNIGHSGLHVTVSETKTDSLTFFKKKGFAVAHEWKDLYIKGTTEFLLACPRAIQAQGEASAIKLDKISALLRALNVHEGDIHILMPLSDGHFITGAKDNCIYKWNENGDLVKTVDDVEPIYQSDKNWITAAERINKQYWVSGKRNGEINLWRTSGEHVRRIKLNFPRGPQYSHELNRKRVMCIAKGLNPENPTIFVGAPTEFEEYNLIEGKSVASTVVDRNDWPYCIFPLAEDSLLLVIGGRIESWKKSQEKWNFSAPVLGEGKKIKGQRQFISSLKPLNAPLFTLSDFAGAVKALDISTQKIVKEWREHEKRVWTTEPLSNRSFASCGEDGLIKIWDLAEQKSVRTIGEPNAREVNALLNFKPNLLIAGTGTSATPGDADRRAQLRFYDLRK